MELFAVSDIIATPGKILSWIVTWRFGIGVTHMKTWVRVFGCVLDALAAERCVWCWNRFENHSNALWELYAKRGVAVQSTVRQVKDALVAAGVSRGLVSSVEYLDRKAHSLPNVLMSEANIFFHTFSKASCLTTKKKFDSFSVLNTRSCARNAGR